MCQSVIYCLLRSHHVYETWLARGDVKPVTAKHVVYFYLNNFGVVCGMNVFSEIYSGWWPEMDIEASEMMVLCLPCIPDIFISAGFLAQRNRCYVVQHDVRTLRVVHHVPIILSGF